jgi:23S rRNA (adenine2503-C2)-methyltransferase
MPTEVQTTLYGEPLLEIERILARDLPDLPKYRAKQIYQWFYAKRTPEFELMTDLPARLRAALTELYPPPVIEPAVESVSADGTIKFLFTLADGNRIESVLIPSEMRDDSGDARRRTLCVSTQVGCPLDCKFCATASLKLKRDLTTAEILLQFVHAERLSGQTITNIVYMGMGEPFLNFENVVSSIKIFTDSNGFGIGSKRITVSTSGLPDEIKRFADEDTGVKLALSLHATTDELRSRLMPINRRYPLDEVLGAMEYYYRKTKIPVTYEYIVFDGLNDSAADAKRLAKITSRMPSKVNVIPFHPIDFVAAPKTALVLKPASQTSFQKFIETLKANDVLVMVRSSAGIDIEAACGQLALTHPSPVALTV